jgi:hypothetical protein
MDKTENRNKPTAVKQRHVASWILLYVSSNLAILINDSSVVWFFSDRFYTYGPLLGLYGFGLFMKTKNS